MYTISWIHIAFGHGYDLLGQHGSRVYPFVSMIVYVIHGFIEYYFGSHALFLLPSMGMPTLRMIHIWLNLDCLRVLTSMFLGLFLELHHYYIC